jgi:hypothetical protein
MKYKFAGSPILYTDNSYRPPPLPEILNFLIGESFSDTGSVGINSVVGNKTTTDFLITSSPEPPAYDDEGWTPTPPSEFTF